MLSTCLTNIMARKRINDQSAMLWRVWSVVARLYVLSGDVMTKAFPMYQQIVDKCAVTGMTSQLWFDIACMFYTGGNLSQAKTILVNILATDPLYCDAGLAKFQLGRILRAQNRIHLSLLSFESIVNAPPCPLTQSDIWYEIGLVHESNKQCRKAADAYMHVVTIPLSAKALARLAWLHAQYPELHQQQQTREKSGLEVALNLFHASLKIDPNQVTTHILLARTLATNNKADTAFTVISNAIAQFPMSVAVWSEMGALYYEAMQYTDAYLAFERALQTQRHQQPVPEVLFNMGVVLDALEKHDEARVKYADAYAISRHPAIETQYHKTTQHNKTTEHNNNNPLSSSSSFDLDEPTHNTNLLLNQPYIMESAAKHLNNSNKNSNGTSRSKQHNLPPLLHLEEATSSSAMSVHIGSRELHSFARDLTIVPLGICRGVLDLQRMLGEDTYSRPQSL